MVGTLSYFNAPSTPADAQSYLNVLVNTINAIEGKAQSIQTQNIIAGVIAGTQTQTSGTLSFVNSNGITFGLSNGSQLTASYTVPGAAGGFTAGMSNLGNTIGTTGVVQSQILFAGGNNVTLSQSVNGQSATITISGVNTVAQTNQTLGAFAVSNTTLSSSNTIDARSLSFAGAGAVSVGISNGSVQISAPLQTAQTQSNIQAIYDGANSISTGTIRFTNANGVSFSINGQTLSGSVAAQTNQSLGLYALSNTTGQSSSSTFDARTLSFNGAGGVSVGYSNGSVVISGAAGGGQTVSTQWFPYPYFMGSSTTGVSSQGNMAFVYAPTPVNVSATRGEILANISGVAPANNTNTNVLLVTQGFGIYTNNAGTLSSLSTTSGTYSVTWTSNNRVSVSGDRLMSIPFTVNMTPGDYYFGVYLKTLFATTTAGGSTTGTGGVSMSLYCASNAAVGLGGVDDFVNFNLLTNVSSGAFAGATPLFSYTDAVMPATISASTGLNGLPMVRLRG